MKRDSLIFLCAALACIGYYEIEGFCKTAGVPHLTVPQGLYAFGQIYRGEKVQHHFLLKNEGEAELEIQNVRASCGCTAASPSQKAVPPGGEAYIEVTFDSRNFVGKVTKTVLVDTNDPSEPTHTLVLEGFVVQEVIAEPSRLMLWQISQDAGRNFTVEVKSTAGLDFTVLEAQSSSRALEVTSIEEKSKGIYDIKLEVKKNSPIGRFGGDLVVHTSSKRQPIITIPFMGEVVGDVSIFPSQLSFGLVQKGVEVTKQVLITIHSQEVQLAKMEVEPRLFSLRGDSDKKRGLYRVNIILSKEAPAGSLAGSLKVYTTSKSQPLINIPISVTIKE